MDLFGGFCVVFLRSMDQLPHRGDCVGVSWQKYLRRFDENSGGKQVAISDT